VTGSGDIASSEKSMLWIMTSMIGSRFAAGLGKLKAAAEQ
jgi:hypothetical protein